MWLRSLSRKYFTFPAQQKRFPALKDLTVFERNSTDPCDVLTIAAEAANLANPCYNTARIADQCPIPESRLYSYTEEDDKLIYFNRTDVKTALHAPLDSEWQTCVSEYPGVFTFTSDNKTGKAADQSEPPAMNGILQKVVERTGNVVIGSGALDMLLVTNGTLLVLQNMTWNGWQGFKEFPDNHFYAPYLREYNYHTMSQAGIVGTWRSERGLTFYQVQLAGHKVAGDAPGASYRVLEVLLGRIDDLGSREPFTTLPGNWTGGELYKNDSFMEVQPLGR